METIKKLYIPWTLALISYRCWGRGGGLGCVCVVGQWLLMIDAMETLKGFEDHYVLYFQMKDLEERRNDAEHRADSAEDKVST